MWKKLRIAPKDCSQSLQDLDSDTLGTCASFLGVTELCMDRVVSRRFRTILTSRIAFLAGATLIEYETSKAKFLARNCTMLKTLTLQTYWHPVKPEPAFLSMLDTILENNPQVKILSPPHIRQRSLSRETLLHVMESRKQIIQMDGTAPCPTFLRRILRYCKSSTTDLAITIKNPAIHDIGNLFKDQPLKILRFLPEVDPFPVHRQPNMRFLNLVGHQLQKVVTYTDLSDSNLRTLVQSLSSIISLDLGIVLTPSRCLMISKLFTLKQLRCYIEGFGLSFILNGCLLLKELEVSAQTANVMNDLLQMAACGKKALRLQKVFLFGASADRHVKEIMKIVPRLEYLESYSGVLFPRKIRMCRYFSPLEYL